MHEAPDLSDQQSTIGAGDRPNHDCLSVLSEGQQETRAKLRWRLLIQPTHHWREKTNSSITSKSIVWILILSLKPPGLY